MNHHVYNLFRLPLNRHSFRIICSIIAVLLFLNNSSLQAQCTNESVINGTFNTNITGWTRSGTGWEHNPASGGIIRNFQDGATEALTQNISNINVTSGYIRLTFDVKMSRVNNTNSSLIVRFGGTDYLSINVTGSTSAVSLVTQNGAFSSTDQGGLTSGKYGTVTLLIPHVNGLTTGDLQFVHSAVGSQNDVEMDNISVQSLCDTPSACNLNAVVNGKFGNSLAGWDISGTGGNNWTYSNGTARNQGDNTYQTLSQSINNVSVGSGSISVSFDVSMDFVSSCTGGTKLEMWFDGTKYSDVAMLAATSITFTGSAGASVVASPSTITENQTARVTVNIPWSGAVPASGLLEFKHNTLGCSASSNDVTIDNVFVGADCLCDLTTSGNRVDYCEFEPTADCGNKYDYYLPAVAFHDRNSPSKMEITTEFPFAQFTVKNANGTTATAGTVTSSSIYTYETEPSNMMTQLYEIPFNDRGFIIESDVPITVKWLSLNEHNQSMVTLRGSSALGTAFRVASVMNTVDSDGPHWLTVMATEDNTKVQIGAPVSASVSLNRGEQFTYRDMNIPVSGIVVISDRAIVVNSGQQHKGIKSGDPARYEGTVIQMLPIGNLGQEYLIVNHEGYNGYQVVAVHNNTRVYKDGTLVTILNAGQVYQYWSPTQTAPVDLRFGSPYLISTSEPAYVYNLASNSAGEFEMFQAPALDLPMGQASKVTYSNLATKGWAVVDDSDFSKLKRNGSSSLGTVNTWVLPAGSSTAAKRIVYWSSNFAPNTTNEITCNDCSSLFVGQFRDSGFPGSLINYINSFESRPIQFFNTNHLPDKLLTFGYTISTVSYRSTPPATLSHVLTEASSAGGLHITGISLSRKSGSTSAGSVASIAGLNFTLNLPPAGSVAQPGDELNVFITTEDAAGNRAAMCMTVLLENNPALPVKLASFNARKEGQTAILNWSTTDEVNSDRFEIERSSDVKNWKQIGVKAANGESTRIVEYNFTDAKILSGVNYYRLKMIDRDNTFAYSNIRSVQVGDAVLDMFVYPNPTSGMIHFGNIDLSKSDNVEIIDSKGTVVFRSDYANSTITENSIDARNLGKGMYVIKVTYKDGSQYTHKVVINK